MNQRIDTIIKRAYSTRCDPIILTEQEINVVEKALDVHFSKDFKDLNKKFGYESFRSCAFNSFSDDDDPTCVVNYTLEARKRGLPKDSLLLYEDDALAIIFNTKEYKVFWLAVEDLENYCINKDLLYEYMIFNSFTDFYEFLLDEEEKLIEEEKQHNQA